jgi:hypothetical protein
MHHIGSRFNHWRSPLIRLGAFPIVAVGFLAVQLPAPALRLDPLSPSSLTAPRAADYQNCAIDLLQSGLAEDAAAAACAEALYPLELSECVVEINENTEISGDDALSSCLRVRRPIELAECVVDIDAAQSEAVLAGVLDYCRRSLLPERFSACVVGLSREVGLAVGEVMNTCISVTDRPEEVESDFIPRGQEQPIRFVPFTP